MPTATIHSAAGASDDFFCQRRASPAIRPSSASRGADFRGVGQLKLQNGIFVGSIDADLAPEFQIALDAITALGFGKLVL